MKQNTLTRRALVKSSVFGFLSICVPNILYSKSILAFDDKEDHFDLPHQRYPAIPLDIAAEVVGVSHFNLDRLKELVDARPELARASWDWGFGDWESAVGAASHTGRKDIMSYLISKGAMPTIFSYALMGSYEVVRKMVDFYPGIQRNLGPHGISLLQHAKLALLVDDKAAKSKAQQLIDYLEALGDADGRTYIVVEENEKEKFLGDYKYGSGKDDGFTIRLNMKKMLSLGTIGKFGGTLYRIAGDEFTYNGAPSVKIKFNVQGDKVNYLTITEPGLTLKAVKVV